MTLGGTLDSNMQGTPAQRGSLREQELERCDTPPSCGSFEKHFGEALAFSDPVFPEWLLVDCDSRAVL